MRDWKRLFSDKRLLLLIGILLFALLATWCESRLNRGGSGSNPAQNINQSATERRAERGRTGDRRQPPRQLPEEFEGTLSPVEQLKPEPAPPASVILREVRSGGRDEFDRVVFEFVGDLPPGFRVEYIDKLTRKCGSNEMKASGGTWLLVRMTPAQAHNESGRSSVGQVGFDEELAVVRRLQQVCDADGQVEWLIEVSERKPYRAEILPEPTRLVIDIKH